MKILRLILAAAIALGATASIAADKTPLANYSGIVQPIQTGDTVPVNHGGTSAATLTTHCAVIGAGTAAAHFACPSTAGFVLVDNGGSSDPTFQALSSGSGGSGLIGIRTITATGAGTYTPTAGTTAIVVELQGAGGGGSGAGGCTTLVNLGGGGGSGGYVLKRLTANFSGASYSVGVKGSGGAAGNNNGGTGGNTTFTDTAGSPTTYTAGGGGPGIVRGCFNTPITATGAAGGTATNGDVNVPGQWGTPANAPNQFVPWGSGGGHSRFGAGGASVFGGDATNSTGNAAGGFGAGGGGAIVSRVPLGTAAGGDGTNGLILIWEYQ